MCMISGRSYTIAAASASTALTPRGSCTPTAESPEDTASTSRTVASRYTFNWVGTHLQEIVCGPGDNRGGHVCHGRVRREGRNEDPTMPGAAGTLTLYVDDQAVGSAGIVTQPGLFCAVGDGICVGRDDASPVTPDYIAPFTFTGGEIDKVVVDVSGDRYVDHEAQVRGWFLLD